MALFRIAMRYSGRSSEEILEFNARTPSEAKKVCPRLMEENRTFLERIRRLNVYSSKILESCRLCEYDRGLELLDLDEVLNSKDNI